MEIFTSIFLIFFSAINDTPLYKLEEVVVVAPREAIHLAVTKDELKSADLKGVPSLDIPNALEDLPGVNYTIGKKGEPILNLRGYDQREILVLIDGIPVYLPYDGQLDLSELPVSSIRKIKVLKGLPSLLYGPNAMGGVIEIVSKSAKKGKNATFEMGWGSGDLGKFSFTSWLGTEDIGLLLSGEIGKRRGFPLPSDFPKKANEDGGIRENSDLLKKAVQAKLSLKKLPLLVSFGLIDNKKGIPPDVNSSRPRYWRFPVWRKGDIILSGEKRGKMSIKGNLFFDSFYNILDSYDDSTYSTQEKKYAFHSIYSDYSVGDNLISRFKFREGMSFRFGLNTKMDVHRAKPDLNERWERYKAMNTSLSFESEITLFRNNKGLAGFGYERLDPLYANGETLRGPIKDFNYFLGFLRMQKNLKLHISFGRRTRFPTLKELYSSQLGYSIPNPELKEEAALKWEVGTLYIPSERIELGVSLFNDNLRGLIERVYLYTDSTGKKIYQMQNIERAEIQGLESSIGLRRRIWGVKASLTLLDAKELTSSGEKDLEYRPPYKFNLSGSIRGIKRLKIRANLEAKGPRPYFNNSDEKENKLEPYTLIGLQLLYAISKTSTLTLGGENLLDKYYEYEDGFPGPGRTFYISLSIHFKEW